MVLQETLDLLEKHTARQNNGAAAIYINATQGCVCHCTQCARRQWDHGTELGVAQTRAVKLQRTGNPGRHLPLGGGVQHARRQRDHERIVAEGPAVVEADAPEGARREVQRRQHIAQIRLHEHVVRRLDGDVRAWRGEKNCETSPAPSARRPFPTS